MRTVDSKKNIKIHIIRHGKTRLNNERKYQGSIDEGLSQAGIDELTQKIKDKKYPDAKVVFVSPMRRAKETASILFEGIKQIEIAEFKEIDFGDFEGKTYEELKGFEIYRNWLDSCVEFVKKYEKLRRDNCNEEYIEFSEYTENDTEITMTKCDVKMPEKITDYIKRNSQGLDLVIKKCHELDMSEAVIVAHGGTIRAISALFSKGYYKYNVACGEYVTFNVSTNGDIK